MHNIENQDMADKYGSIIDKSTMEEVKERYEECFIVERKKKKNKKDITID